jgi:hypothetical protein
MHTFLPAIINGNPQQPFERPFLPSLFQVEQFLVDFGFLTEDEVEFVAADLHKDHLRSWELYKRYLALAEATRFI